VEERRTKELCLLKDGQRDSTALAFRCRKEPQARNAGSLLRLEAVRKQTVP
jgi:hypothetical protein